MESEVSQGTEITCVYHRTIIDVCLRNLIQTLHNIAATNGDAEEIMNKFCVSRHF